MTAPTPAPSASAVARLKERLSQSWSRSVLDAGSANANRLPVVTPARPVGFPVSIAEFLLVLRLRARRPASPCGDILERAVRVVFVTCKHWFGATDLLKQHRRH